MPRSITNISGTGPAESTPAANVAASSLAVHNAGAAYISAVEQLFVTLFNRIDGLEQTVAQHQRFFGRINYTEQSPAEEVFLRAAADNVLRNSPDGYHVHERRDETGAVRLDIDDPEHSVRFRLRTLPDGNVECEQPGNGARQIFPRDGGAPTMEWVTGENATQAAPSSVSGVARRIQGPVRITTVGGAEVTVDRTQSWETTIAPGAVQVAVFDRNNRVLNRYTNPRVYPSENVLACVNLHNQHQMFWTPGGVLMDATLMTNEAPAVAINAAEAAEAVAAERAQTESARRSREWRERQRIIAAGGTPPPRPTRRRRQRNTTANPQRVEEERVAPLPTAANLAGNPNVRLVQTSERDRLLDMPLSELMRHGATESDIEFISADGVSTVGGLESYRTSNELTEIPGVTTNAQVRIADALRLFWLRARAQSRVERSPAERAEVVVGSGVATITNRR